MNPDDLMRAIGEISDRYITEALVDEENGGFLEETGADFSDCLTDYFADFSEAENEGNIKTLEIPSREVIEISEKTEAEDNGGEKIPEIITLKTKAKFKKLAYVAIIVICLGMILTSVNFVARACGIDTIGILKQFGYRIVEMVAGEKEEFKNITIKKSHTPRTYESFDSFYEAEKNNILYPTWLPENIDISYIHILNYAYGNEQYDDEHKEISYVTGVEGVGLRVETGPNSEKRFLEDKNLEIREINGFVCYIFKTRNEVQCTFMHDDMKYTIKLPKKYDIVKVVEGMKKLK